jgi:hypothetical protein
LTEVKRCGIIGCKNIGGYPIGMGIPGYPQYLLCEDHFIQLHRGLEVDEDMAYDEPKKFPYVACSILVVIIAALCILV